MSGRRNRPTRPACSAVTVVRHDIDDPAGWRALVDLLAKLLDDRRRGPLPVGVASSDESGGA